MTPEFEVEAGPTGRITVKWREGEKDLWFMGDFEGDKLTAVHGGMHRPAPTIFTRRPGRGGVGYEDAGAEPWAALVAAMAAKIKAGKLATTAVQVARDRREQRERDTIRNKAQAVREALLKINVAAVEALSRTPDQALADMLDDLQNAVW